MSTTTAMQERRTTIRMNRLSRAQYCPADDLVPRDGRLTNLSERGAGLFLRETHRIGERITVSFVLPDTEESLTATGVVRWSDDESRQGRWYPLGVEWLGFDDASRRRLNTFIGQHAQAMSQQRPQPVSRTSRRVRQGLFLSGIVSAFAVVAYLAYQLVAIQQQNRQLGEAIGQRDSAIRTLEHRQAHLKARETELQQELTRSRTQLELASESVSQLGTQTQDMESKIHRLNEEVERFQQSYVQVREEREELMQRVLDLQQERMLLQRKLASVPDLHRAIREAIHTRKQEQRLARLKALQAVRAQAEKDWSIEGNRGYLVRNGKPTGGRPTMWIRVLDPESELESASSTNR